MAQWIRVRLGSRIGILDADQDSFRFQAGQNCLQRPKKEKVKKFYFGKFPFGLEASPEVRLFFEGF
jgi:hypothetical protein